MDLENEPVAAEALAEPDLPVSPEGAIFEAELPPVAAPDPAPVRTVIGAEKPEPVFSYDELGRAVSEDGKRDLFVRIGGARWEHVTETKDGKWVYVKS